MFKEIGLLIAIVVSSTSMAQGNVYVHPHVDKNGNYREGHNRTTPNVNRYDNFNSQNNQFGGVNPYTGQRGHQKDEYSNPPVYNPCSGYSPSPSYQQPNPYGNPPRSNRRNGLP